MAGAFVVGAAWGADFLASFPAFSPDACFAAAGFPEFDDAAAGCGVFRPSAITRS